MKLKAFFNRIPTHWQYNKEFLVNQDHKVVCLACNLYMPTCTDEKPTYDKFLQHIQGEIHVQNILKHILSKVYDNSNTDQVSIVSLIFKENFIYCEICDCRIGDISLRETTVNNIKIHINGSRHNRKSVSLVSKTTNINDEHIEATKNDLDRPRPNTERVYICSVCENQIEIYNHDLPLSIDMHKQDPVHINACKMDPEHSAVSDQCNDKVLEEIFKMLPVPYNKMMNCGLFENKGSFLQCIPCGYRIPFDTHISGTIKCVYDHLTSPGHSKNQNIYNINKSMNKQKADADKTNPNDDVTIKDNIVSELFQCLPPSLKSNECVISVVGNLLYCTVCTCYINTSANKFQTLTSLKMHLETIHCENLLKKVFDLFPQEFEFSKQFIFYKGEHIMCSLCNITGITHSQLRIPQTVSSVLEHLKGKQHQNNLIKIISGQSKEKDKSSKNKEQNIDIYISKLSTEKQELAQLLKKNKNFLEIKNNSFLCKCCEKTIGDIIQIKSAVNSISLHFKSKKHLQLMKQKPNTVSKDYDLLKLVFDCYAPPIIKSNKEYIVKSGNSFICTVCSEKITGKNCESIIKQLSDHLVGQHHVIKRLLKI